MMENVWGRVLLESSMTILSHPAMYIKVLLQVGYEPLPPTLRSNQVYKLPGAFAYAKHIAKIDGKAGLFNGLAPNLCHSALRTVVHGRVLRECQKGERFNVLGDAEEGSVPRAVNETIKETIAESCSIIATHPFHLITVRCMVQFIGRETKYAGVSGSILTVYREEGVLGFFAGLTPRLVGGVLFLWTCNLLTHLTNRYAIEDDREDSNFTDCSKNILRMFSVSVVSVLTYPFVLVSNLMAVNNCGLAGGRPPRAPVYPSWVHCWSHLSKEGNMSRGSMLFCRTLQAGRFTYSVVKCTFLPVKSHL